MTSDSFSELEITLSQGGANEYLLAMRFWACGNDGGNASDHPLPFKVDLNPLGQYPTKVEIVEYGKALTKQVFAEPQAKADFEQYITSAQRLGKPLRIQIIIDKQAYQLHKVVWETLTHPQNGELLTINENIWFSRHLFSKDMKPVSPVPMERIRAVMAVSNARNLESHKFKAIQVNQEIEHVKAHIESIAKMRILRSDHQPITLDYFVNALRLDDADIVYLVCHGYINNGEPFLALENTQGDFCGVHGQELVDEIKKFSRLPRLIVLVSCQSADNDETAKVFSTLGPLLAIEAGVPAVLAMQGKISMDTIRDFAPAFFQQLERDGQIDRALAVARNAVRKRDDFWMPVLFMRSASGKLWDLHKNTSKLDSRIPPLLPYSPNRTLQEDKLSEMFSQRQKLGNRPVVAVVYGDEQQSQLTFFERMWRNCIPKILKSEANDYPRSEVFPSSHLVEWPLHLQSMKDFERRFLKMLAQTILQKENASMDEIQQTLETLALLDGPVVLGTHCPIDVWDAFGVSALNGYLDFWQKWPDLVARQDLFIFLFFQYPRPKSWLNEQLKQLQNKHLTKYLQSCSFKQYSRLVCDKLPELSNVTLSEAEAWVRQEDALRNFYEPWELQDEMQRLFARFNGSVPMQTLGPELKKILALRQKEFYT